MTTSKQNKKIPKELYAKIQKLFPIACVDIIILTEKGILLGTRNQEPVKNYNWVIGGRIFYGESFKQAVNRKALEESGLKVKILKQVGVYPYISTKGEIRHSIAIVFLVKKIGGKIKMNKEYSDYSFINNNSFDKETKNLHPYIIQILKDSGVFNRV